MKIPAFLVLLLGGLTTGFAQSPGPEKPFSDPSAADRLIDKAFQLQMSGDPVGALKALEGALAFCPNNARLHLDNALQGLANHDYAVAKTEVVAAYRGYPPLAKIFYMSGFTRLLAKDYYGAIQDLSLSLFIEPQRYFQYMPRGQARFEVGDYQGAIDDFTVLIQSPQQTAVDSVYLARGRARFEINDGPGALADLTKAIDRNGDAEMFEAYTFRSWQHLRDGNLAAAVADCSAAIKINPRFIRHYSDRSWLYHELKDPAAAHRDADAAIALLPALPRSWLCRGVLYEAEDQVELAAADYLKSISLADAKSDRGSSIYACFSLDLLNRRTKRPAYQDYLKDVFDWTDDWPKRVALYLAGKTSDDSLERDARNTKDPKARPRQECEACYYIGVNHLVRGELETARDYLQRALATGQVRLIEYQLARAHLQRLQGNPPAPAKGGGTGPGSGGYAGASG